MTLPLPHALDKAVGYVIRQGAGAESVYKTLVENLTAKSIDTGLAAVFGIPWRRIYTTNYDESIEISRHAVVPTNSCILEDGIEKAKVGTVLHINGRLKLISPASIEQGLSLSDRSYASRNFDAHQWHTIFVRDLETARAVIFVGYSLYDLDITRMLFSANISEKTFFYVSPNVDEIEKESLELVGQVVDGGAGALISSAREAASIYKPSSTAAGFVNLVELKPQSVRVASNPTRTLDKQLVFGILPEQEVLAGDIAFASQPYLVSRKQQRDAEDLVRRGVARDITIVGELASGKSACALDLCATFIQQGYRVFLAEKGRMLADELIRLAAIDDRIVVLFEGYAGHRDQIRTYAAARNSKHRLIMTERAIHHEFIGDFIYEPNFAGQMALINLDRIDKADSNAFAEIVNFGGYWGERSGASIDAHSRYIQHNLDGSLYKLLLEIIESKDIQDRINSLLTPVFINNAATKLFVTACISNVLGIDFRISEWPSLFEGGAARRTLRMFRDDLSYFLAIETDRVFPRNGLLSASILRKVPDRSVVLSTAVELFSFAARMRTPRDMYDDVHVQMMRFNVIEPILQGPNAKALIFKYYEDIRPLSDTRNISDYWLQLGIAATALDELGIAGDAFKNAYAREQKKRHPNPKKIDNYFSRYQLKASAASSSPHEAYDLFIKGTNGISKQIFLDDNKHYPFKSGRSYGEIAAKHYDKWSDKQKENFIAATKDIRDRAVAWQRKNSGHNVDVEYLIRDTGDLLQRISTH